MLKFEYVIKDKRGLHARPAGHIMSEACKYHAEITLQCGEEVANCKKIASLMSLFAQQGETLRLTTCGVDETAALQGMSEVLRRYL